MINEYSDLPLEDKLKKKIFSYYQTTWRDKWYEEGGIDIINSWLNNFNNCLDFENKKNEQLNMLYLLSKFMYFGNKEMRQLLSSIFRDLYKYPIIHKIRKENNDTIDCKFLESRFTEELEATRFLGVGNPSESGVHLLYYFRQECKLSKEKFIYPNSILKSSIVEVEDSAGRKRNCLESNINDETVKRYVFIDDFCGSGTQAKDYLYDLIKNIRFKMPNLHISYLMIFCTEYGLKNIKNLKIFDQVEAVFCLDESFKAFSKDSRYFKDELNEVITKKESLELVTRYGKKISSLPLGYSDCQLMLSMFHNTPDNTLPIFWSSYDFWKPIFPRFNKIY